jgi:pimeloyl-ACP methyl ester carboxylesterase
LSGLDYDADTAERYGWINRALPDAEIRDFVVRLARRIASFPASSIAAVKSIVNQTSPISSSVLNEDSARFWKKSSCRKYKSASRLVSVQISGSIRWPYCIWRVVSPRRSAAPLCRRFIEAMAYVRAYPIDLPSLRAALPGIRTPVLSIWGAHDPIVPPENADVLGRALPRMRSVLLDSGHFVWEDRAEDYAAAILDWIRGGYRAA